MSDETLNKALTALPAPALDSTFAARVLARARAELAVPAKRSTALDLRLALRGALVPALLSVAAVGRTALTVEAAATIYEGGRASSNSKP